MMKCILCKHGHLQTGLATVTLNREECVVVFKDVPADICENCGEYYLSDEVAEVLLQRAEDAVQAGTEVEVRRYAA
jgi:YgiT-type zinc finger domain-containing protein